MITFVDSAAMERERESDRCLDPQLWHACAGGMVQMPAVHSKVYYFPQGHAEHAQGPVDLPAGRVPALVLCRVAAVRFMADPDTDEVFAKIRLAPVRPNEPGYADDAIGAAAASGAQEDKPASFAKTLTQSDANNGGGFSVPRYCAETIFPRLDYSADPPVQTVLAKDVHGVVWKFRHIYRGTPRRHLLTTGWSTFVNQKKLVAGDSIVFMRTENGDLCVGIRRAKKGGIGGPEFMHHHHQQPPPPQGGGYAGFSMFLRGEEDGGKMMAAAATRGKAARVRVRPEEVVEAANLAVSGQPFEVVYYPRASTPEFCVKAGAVRAAMRTQWCPGMRFKMAFETEDSSRISWFMGTVSAVHVADPIRWPNSPWRLLQVAWDEPDLLQNVKRVSPWLVELVSNMPVIHHLTATPFSPPRKKLCVPLYPELPLEGQFPAPMFHGSPLLGRGGAGGPMCYFPDGTPAGIQGARHAQFGISLSDLHLNKLQPGLSPHGLHRQLDHGVQVQVQQPRIAAGLIVGGHPAARDDVSCLLTIGTPKSKKPPSDVKKASTAAAPQLMLFGKAILTEQQISLGGGNVVPALAKKSPSDDDDDVAERTVSNSDVSSPGRSNQDGTSSGGGPAARACWQEEECNNRAAGSEDDLLGHCKVFMQSEDVGRTLDLSAVASYEELYQRLADMFGVDKAELTSHVFYRDDASGALKHPGDEPFSEFTKTARRLTILTDESSDSLAR
ncbi:Auxin response factor 16 [Zea mays]|uniref:Auxin response factor n=4 Tax=Zea mays TaxID=4577 RepID=A0A1D6GTU9_MAIZE|nr:Auxin response factor 16 [Zea mays]AQK66414.1 Auxin response factor 16 [Zea mays]AQK66415.1 Auxin response factor 16 [Zea mays]|eukprot:XP_008643508.1 auxin response factor 16 isoform X1 [Zea mays]